jgi:hypothetical protein
MVMLNIPDNVIDDISMSARAHLAIAQSAIDAATVADKAEIERLNQVIKANDALYAEVVRRNEGLLKTNREQSEMLKQAAAEIEHLKQQDGDNNRYDALRSSIEEHLGIPHNTSIYEAINALKNRIAELEKPPVIVVPEEPKPVSDVYPFVGVYIEDPRKSDNVDDQQQAKEHFEAMLPTMEFCAESPDIDSYIMFGNPQDVKFGQLFKTAARLKKRLWQSPIQAFYIPGAQSQTVLIDHLKNLHDAGVYGAIIDDANNLDAADTVHLIDLINRHMPGAPVMASFLANFDDIAAGYPHERYIDIRQWFLRNNEKESVWFKTWETAHDAEVWAADVWKRPSGFMHTPERVESMFRVALPMVNGICWYSMLNQETNHMVDHIEAKKKNADTRTMWNIIEECSAVYRKTWEAQQAVK